MRGRWIIATFLVVTVASIVTYVANGPVIATEGGATRGEVDIVTAAEAHPDEDEAAPGHANPFAPRAGEDPLIDRTIGEDVRPEEERAAEAAALAAAQGRMQPVPTDGEQTAAEGE